MVSEAACQATRMKDVSCAYGREERPSGGGQGVGPLKDAIGMTRAREDEREDGGGDQPHMRDMESDTTGWEGETGKERHEKT